MTMLELVKHLNFAVVVLFTLLYLYQGFYVVVGLVRRRWQDRHQPSRLHRFAVIVSARNEENMPTWYIRESRPYQPSQNMPQTCR